MNIHWPNVERRRNNSIIKRIKDNLEPLKDGDLIKEITIENKELIRPVYYFLIKNFDSYDEAKSLQCLVLTNILFLTNIQNRLTQADRVFLRFIIDKLLKEEKYFEYGLISLHLFLNRFDEYNIYLFIKNLSDNQKNYLFDVIIKGLIENKTVEPNPNGFFDMIDIKIETKHITISNLNYINFFDKLFGYNLIKCNDEPLNQFKEKILRTIEENIDTIFIKPNIFHLLKCVYLLFYDTFNDLFERTDKKIKENLTLGQNILKISELSSFLQYKWDHPFFKKFLFDYTHLIDILEERGDIHQIGIILGNFNFIYAEADFIQKRIIDKIEIYVRMQDYGIINKVYEHLRGSIRHKVKTIGLSLRRSLNRLSTIVENELNDIIDFLDADWRMIKSGVNGDNKLNEKFKLLFYYLGFEVILLELLKNLEKYKPLTTLVHPDVILYNFDSDLIILIEEETKLKTTSLYKKDVIQANLELFRNLFPKGYNNVIFQYLTGSVSSAIDQLDKPPKIILKNKFIELLKKIFNPDILSKNIFEDDDLRDNLKKIIDILKGKINLN